LSINRARLIVFCLSAFIAGLGGILYGTTIGYASSADTSYIPLYSLILLAQLAIARSVRRTSRDDRLSTGRTRSADST
jgi:ABC-type branched-subunit amino acid transport system permease subunit